MGRKSLKSIRQQEIIEAFYKVAKGIGYENTSIAKVATEMGINPSLIIHYFASKEDLKYALIDYILDRYLLIFDIGPRKKGLDRIKTVMDRLFSKKWNNLFDDGLFYTFYAEIFREERIKKKYKAILDGLRSALAEIIEELNDQGLLGVKQVKSKVDLVFVMVDGAYFYLSLVDDKRLFNMQLATYKKEAYSLLGIDQL